ncbi:MAG: hypothetical protein U0229_04595 [Anaeromyxobacter sp.]
MLATLAAALLATTPPATPRAPPAGGEAVHALVARCVQAHGGPAALAKAARQQQVGTVTSLLHPGAAGKIGRVYERSGRLRVEVQWPGEEGEIRVVDGDRGWRQGQEARGGYLASMMLQAVRLDLPATLANWEARLEDRGEQVVDGKKVRVLAFPYAPGLVVETALDPTSGRIVRSRGYSTGADKVEFITTYEDYRLVDGVLVAFREVNWANGRNTGETVVEQAGFPAALPAEMWRP